MKKKHKTKCKICNSYNTYTFKHTLKCRECGVLLFYPYPLDQILEIENSANNEQVQQTSWDSWYSRAAKRNHINFTNMFLFTIPEPDKLYNQNINILDYGGGGGQFALICKSFLPKCSVYITDINDFALLKGYEPLNKQIKWGSFEKDDTKFDYIFLNDVFEHVNDPEKTLKILYQKLKSDGTLFIDTPRQFWLYNLLKVFNKRLYYKLLKGTVSQSHLQIWTFKSFLHVINRANLTLHKKKLCTEFTMNSDHYLKNLGISNQIMIKLGRLFYSVATFVGAKNKFMLTLKKNN